MTDVVYFDTHEEALECSKRLFQSLIKDIVGTEKNIYNYINIPIQEKT